MQTLETVVCSTAVLGPSNRTAQSMDYKTSQINLRLKKPAAQSTLKGTSLEKSEQVPKNGLTCLSGESENHRQILKNGSLHGVKINGTNKLNGEVTKSPEKAKHSSSNGSVEFKPLNNSVTIRNGTIRLLANGSSSGSNNIHGIKCLAEFKEGNSFKAPSNIPTNDALKILKKVKMSTVAKRVPLINTVGNHSKLIPLTLPPQNQVVSTASTDSFASTVSTKNVSKPMSILEARLTYTASNVSKDLSSQESEKSHAKSIDEPSLSLSLSSSQLCSTKEPLLKRIGISVDDIPDDLKPVPSKKLKTLRPGNQEKKSSKPIFGFERGLTRLVAVESRTVTMVDVGMQVFIPEENGEEESDSPPPAVSSVSSGFTQASITSTMPSNNKQLVVVDTKNGKKVLAISKSVLINTSVGPKVIGGKLTNIQLDSLCSVSMGPGSTLESNTQISTEQKVNDVQLSLSKGLARGIVLGSNQSLQEHRLTQIKGTVSQKESNGKDDIGDMPSLSTDTVTTPSSQALSSITTPLQTSSISSSSAVVSEFSAAFSNSIPPCDVSSGSIQALPLQATASNKTVTVTSNSLILPFNSPIKFDSSNFANYTSLPGSGSKSVSVSQSCTFQSKNTPSDSTMLPSLPGPNSISSVRSLPNTTSFYIMVPSSINQDQSEPDNLLQHEMGEADPDIINFINRQIKRSSFESPAKRKCVEASWPEKVGVVDCTTKATSASYVTRNTKDYADSNVLAAPSHQGLHNSKPGSYPQQKYPNVAQWDSINKGIGSSNGGLSNGIGKEELSKYVKNAFLDFKNCLAVNKAGKLPIHVAVEKNDFAAVKRQCIVLKARGVSVDITNSKDETPLQLALYSGYSSIAKLLLQHDADATVLDPEGNSTLHLSVVHAHEALESLLHSGQLDKKIMNSLNDEGFSALHLAAQLDKVNAINLLIKYGAEVDLPDGKSGRTALFHAAERKHYKSQKTLVDNGADMKEPTFTGSTPFTITRSDAIAQLTNGENTIAEEIDSDSLLLPSKRKSSRNK